MTDADQRAIRGAMADETASAFDRGVEQGKVLARIDNLEHDVAAITNGQTRIVDELRDVKLALQRLTDQQSAAAAIDVATRRAVTDAEEARRQLDAQRWRPWQRRLAVLAVLVTVAGVVVSALALTL